jgi:hypothetical protein
MDNDVVSKQKYLCSEIMLKDYDPDDFTQWMDRNTDKGRDRIIQVAILRNGRSKIFSW